MKFLDRIFWMLHDGLAYLKWTQTQVIATYIQEHDHFLDKDGFKTSFMDLEAKYHRKKGLLGIQPMESNLPFLKGSKRPINQH